MILWLMFIMVIGVGVSILTGSAEMSFLGNYIDQSPVYEFLQVFVVWGQEGFLKAAAITFVNLPEVLGAFVNALMWNYAILRASVIGQVVQIVLILVITAPVLLGLIIELVSRLKPT